MDQPAATETEGASDRDRRDIEAALGLPVLATLVRTSAIGIALLDSRRRCLYVNPAGCRILGRSLDELAGRPAPFGPVATADSGEPGETVGRWFRVRRFRVVDVDTGDGSSVAVEYTENGFGEATAARIAVYFRDVTEARRQERRLAAFAKAASSLAYAGSLQQVLDRVAADVLPPTGAEACAIVLIDPHTHAFRMAGTAGLRDDYLDSLEKCRQRGAPLRPWRHSSPGGRRLGVTYNGSSRIPGTSRCTSRSPSLAGPPPWWLRWSPVTRSWGWSARTTPRNMTPPRPTPPSSQ